MTHFDDAEPMSTPIANMQTVTPAFCSYHMIYDYMMISGNAEISNEVTLCDIILDVDKT
jgi:hypothetical protein